MKKMIPLKDDIHLSCTIVSDTHIDVKHPVKSWPMFLLRLALADSARSLRPQDAFIVVGDTTSRGSRVNWDMTRKVFSLVKSPAKRILLCVGNHDCWHDDGFEAAQKEYFSAFKDICGIELDMMYFSYEMNGCSFIFLGNEEDAGCEAHISDEQIEWLDGEMKYASRNGRPIFVFCHQSLNGRHGLPRTWEKEEDPNAAPDEGGIGDKSEEVAAILKKYKNVFYFSGHSHMGLCGEDMFLSEGYASFEEEDGVNLINLPSLACGNHHGEVKDNPVGLVLEVYDDSVVIRPRDFLKRKWIENINVRNMKPYLEVSLK